MVESDLPVERRETSPFTRTTRHPFQQPPGWITAWLHGQNLDPNLTETEGLGLRIDVVYTWVNGSDPRLQTIKEEYEDASPLFKAFRASRRTRRALEANIHSRESVAYKNERTTRIKREMDQTAKRFRDMDELKYSVRSVAQYATGMFEKIYILATTVDSEANEGQVPSWLNRTLAEGVVEVVQHDEIFENTAFLPTFNSLAIESQMHHIPGLSDVFLYLNDDVFLGTQMRAADVWTPLYGFVFHLEPTLLVPPTILETPENTIAIGEWNSLQYSNYLLSRQFGPRYRPYLAHVPHVLSVPMLQEIQALWPEEFKNTSSHRFRGEGQAKDVQVSFFLAHYVMERLRETMLSSYWFHRLDSNQDGVLDWIEREQLVQRIHSWNQCHQEPNRNNNPSSHHCNTNYTSYLRNTDTNLRQLGYAPTGSTVYRYSGLDGYPFMFKSGDTSTDVRSNDRAPYLTHGNLSDRTCQLDLDFCFGTNFTDRTIKKIDMSTSNEIFERFAFTQFHCGDCLLYILRQTSNGANVSTSTSTNSNGDDRDSTGDFSGLGADILPLESESEAYRRVIVDLAKYNFVTSTSAYAFVQLQEPVEAKRSLDQIQSQKYTAAFFCINDNVGDDPRVANQVRQVFKQFLETRFPISSPWEMS
ncbi:Xanthine phosphoribosyltransferase 1 [Mortierella alpina]|uniref:Xanthine phosphoribosyltransferase 1 n=1 Tax=Mortierella alpina TaxID=64518 RepID=A0A9P6J6N3_MORAP|nr:Xanthine phosphoribosyltransferase 1 [Mortierella alpina]